ncbi:MAG TPA: TadE family protein [Candidatus Xenobia bacterium]
MIEFAFVVILLIALVYGIVSLGLSLAAKATITQAAADGARAGIVAPSSTAAATAIAQASQDLSWMGKGACNSANITCTAGIANCSSDSPTGPFYQCLTVKVLYNYALSPLFPPMPGIGILDPSSISSTSSLQMSTN